MRLKALCRAGFVLGAVALASPAFAASDVVAGVADAGKTVVVHSGDELTVNLPGRHDSGKFWRLDADLTPELVLAGRTTNALDVKGAAETTSFTFAAAMPGTVTFEASYVTGGPPTPKSSQISFTVDVIPAAD